MSLTFPHLVTDKSFASLDVEQLLPAFEKLVADTVAQVDACPAKPDATFEGYESLLAAIRSATTLEGLLLEKGIALVAGTNADLTVVTLDRPLPVAETAKALFRRNDWSKAAVLRLDSEVATREFYKPDLLFVAASRQLALIIDVKRSVASYKQRTLSDLRSRMMASALMVRDVLERDHDAPPVARADIAIIEGASECRDETRGVFALADLDWLLRIEGAADAIDRLRSLYGLKVRALLDARCEAILAPRLAARNRGRGAERKGGSTTAAALVAVDVDNSAIDDDTQDEDLEDARAADTPSPAPQPGAASRPCRPRIAVGIATRGVH
jgi:hypothetical protein